MNYLDFFKPVDVQFTTWDGTKRPTPQPVDMYTIINNAIRLAKKARELKYFEDRVSPDSLKSAPITKPSFREYAPDLPLKYTVQNRI